MGRVLLDTFEQMEIDRLQILRVFLILSQSVLFSDLFADDLSIELVSDVVLVSKQIWSQKATLPSVSRDLLASGE